MNHPHASPPSRNDLLAAALQKFPYLQKYAGDYSVVQGRPMGPGDDRQLESYAPDESWNPVPGKATTEIYNNTAPQDQQVNLVAGDMLHHLAQVDPRWAQMKANVAPQSMSPQRQDEFLMGSLTPDKNDDWRGRPGTHLQSQYSPEQDAKLKLMAQYLMGKQP